MMYEKRYIFCVPFRFACETDIAIPIVKKIVGKIIIVFQGLNLNWV